MGILPGSRHNLMAQRILLEWTPVAAQRPFKIGLNIPNGTGYMAQGIERWDQLLACARLAEDVGFDSVWVADHMLFRFPNETETQSRWECWSVLSGLAMATQRVEIGPLVSCMGFRNPAHLAKLAHTVDEMSNGRLVLAVGAGWHEPEFTSHGFPFDHRASRFEEGMTVLHELLRTGKSNFSGEYFHLIDGEVAPVGPRPTSIPIIGGTNGPRLLRITAQLADGWNTDWIGSPDVVPALRAAVDAACAEVGRDPATLRRSACVYIDLPTAKGRFPLPRVDERQPGPQSHQQIIENIHRYKEEGLDEIMLWPDPFTLESIEEVGMLLQQLDRDE